MTAAYKILFTIDLLHDYYTKLACNDFIVVPSVETALLLKDHKMIYKFLGNRLIILVKVNELDEPFSGIDIDKKLVFYLELLQPVFMNITNIDLDLMRLKRFYFANLNQNKEGANLYITNKIDDYILPYNNSISYQPGDRVAAGAAIVYECIRATTAGITTANNSFWKSIGNFQYQPGSLADNGTGAVFECIRSARPGVDDTTERAFWIERNKFQYASAQDMLLFVTKMYHYQTAVEAKFFSITVFGLNKISNNYDREITLDKNVIETSEPTGNVQFDLSQLPSGKYRLKINADDPFDIYLSDTPLHRGFFGIIEIFTHLANTNDFGLLDVNGKVKDSIEAGVPVLLNYSIRFANRLAHWKYFTPRHGVNDITGSSIATAVYSFTKETDYFLSDAPIPLVEKPILFNLGLTGSSDPPYAPNPDPQVAGVLTKKEDKFYFNIYLNY